MIPFLWEELERQLRQNVVRQVSTAIRQKEGLGAGRLLDVYKRVRTVEYSERNVERLVECYDRVKADDPELLGLICQRPGRHEVRPINLMTEAITKEDVTKYLTMPHTVTLELPREDEPDGPPLGFLSIRHAGYTPEDHEEFRGFLLNEQLTGPSFRTDMEPERRRYLEGLENGDLFYIVEFASDESRFATSALIGVATLEVLEEIQARRGRDFQGIVARCLKTARIGEEEDYINRKGNERIEAFNSLLEMKVIAMLAQRDRPLRVPADQTALWIPRDEWDRIGIRVDGSDAITPAKLNFSMHYGSYRRVREALNGLQSFTALSTYVARHGRARSSQK